MADVKDIPLRPASGERDLGGETPEISEGFLIIEDLFGKNRAEDDGFVFKEKDGVSVYMRRADGEIDVRIHQTLEVDDEGHPIQGRWETYCVGVQGLINCSYKSTGENIGWAEVELSLSGSSKFDHSKIRFQATSNLASKLEAFFATPEAANSQK